MTEEPCLICETASPFRGEPRNGGTLWHIECPRCCDYQVMNTDRAALRNAMSSDERRIANASGWLREHHGSLVDQRLVERLSLLKTPSVSERAMKLLRYYARENPTPGAIFEAKYSDLAMVARSWAVNAAETEYLVRDYLLGVEYLSSPGKGGSHGGLYMVRISPTGWAKLEAERFQGGPSRAIFVAMCFDPELAETREAICRAVSSAGYEPLLLDELIHNNLIDVEILAGIRRSRLLVADFTRHRGGVYFEAGFALGLGLPVVRTCSKADERDLHFDVNHYNILFWERERLDTFQRLLSAGIQAEVGLGPMAVPSAATFVGGAEPAVNTMSG